MSIRVLVGLALLGSFALVLCACFVLETVMGVL